MRTLKSLENANGAKFADNLLRFANLKNDRALAAYLGTTPSRICKIRAGILPISASLILATHDATGLAISEIRAMGSDD